MEDTMKELATKYTKHAKITTDTYKPSEIELVGATGTVYTCGGCGFYVVHEDNIIPAVVVFAPCTVFAANAPICPECTTAYICYLAQIVETEGLSTVGGARALAAEQEKRKTDEK